MTKPTQDQPHGTTAGHDHPAPQASDERPDAAQADFENLVDQLLASPGGVQGALGKLLTTAQRIVRQVGNIDERMHEGRKPDARAIAGDVLKAQSLLVMAHRILQNRLVEL